MPITYVKKQAIVAEVAADASEASALILAEYRGLSCEQLSQLRVSAREQDLSVRVVKNSLAKRGLQSSAYATLDESLSGPLLLVFARQDPVDAARLLVNFAKDNQLFVLRGGGLGERALNVEQIHQLSKMPRREQALGMLLSVMQAPMLKLVLAMSDIPGRMVRVLHAVGTQEKQ